MKNHFAQVLTTNTDYTVIINLLSEIVLISEPNKVDEKQEGGIHYANYTK